MRMLFLLLLGLISIRCPAATNTASFLAQGQSFALKPVNGADALFGEVTTVFTTFDGATVPPLHMLIGANFLYGDEVRPRANAAGIMETDYAIHQRPNGLLIEYGSLALTVPTTDADSNGLPDFLQRDTVVDTVLPGTGNMDYSVVGGVTVTGTLRRNAGALRGTYTIGLTRSNGRSTTHSQGVWALLRIAGSMEYSRDAKNSLKLSLSMTNIDGTFSTLTGSAIYTAPDDNRLVLPQMTLTRSNGGRSMLLAPLTLNRSGQRYTGNALLADGYLATSWADYTKFVVEIVDTNDANTNSVPDLTDITLAPDTTNPKLTFKTPSANARVTNAVITIRGTASDNIGIARVVWAIGTNAFQNASGTTNWTASAPLEIGTNLVFVVAYDYRSNASASVIRRIIRQPVSPLTVLTSGRGTVKPNLNGASLIIGNTYTLTAQPASRHLFAGWSSNSVAATAKLKFQMQSNLVLQANFVTNPFYAVKGSYHGLFQATQPARHENSGAFTASVTDQGKFSGTLRTDGQSYSVSGQFDLAGQATKSIRFQKTNSLLVSLYLDLTNNVRQITGTLTHSNWTALLLAHRPVFGTTNPAPFAGRYTMNITGDTNAAQPFGLGVASIVVKSNGSMTLSGTLADGTRAALAAPISPEGTWPLYLALYRGRGSVFSWLTFTNSPTERLFGEASWTKLTAPKDKLYPGGFTNLAYAYGSTYSASAMTNFLASHTNACLEVTALLPEIQTNCLTLLTRRTFSGPGVKALKLDLTTGIWTGTYTNPSTAKAIPLKATLLQQMNQGGGYVLSTNQSAPVGFYFP